MYTYKEETDDGDTFYTLWEGGKKFGEVWRREDAVKVTQAMNAQAPKKPVSLMGILSELSPVEPTERNGYPEDLDRLVTACRMSQEVDTSRQSRRLLMAFLAARLNAYLHEVPGTKEHERTSANGGLRILITISFLTKPGIINGLSKVHTPINNLWSLDAQQYWSELHAGPG